MDLALAQKITHALAALRAGKVVAHATETCYGFTCDALNQGAVRRLYFLKAMPENKPVSLMVGSHSLAEEFGVFSESARKLAAKFWPGPLTIVVHRSPNLPAWINSGHQTIGFRFPDHALTRKLLEEFRGILTTTSANVSSLPSPYSAEEIRSQFIGKDLQPDFILDSGAIPRRLPSTVVDCSGKNPVIIRTGEIDRKQIFSSLQE